MKHSSLSIQKMLLRMFIPLFLFGMTDIRSMAGQPVISPERKGIQPLMSSEEGSTTEKGKYMAFFSLGMLPGSMDIIETTPISLGMSHGYYSQGLFLGVGMNVENFQPAFLPVYADLRIFLFPKEKIHPWIRGIVGKTFLFPESFASSEQGTKNVGKVATGVGAGISYPLNHQHAFYFYLGYRYMQYSGKSKNYLQNPVVNNFNFNRMEFRVGFSF